MPMDCRALRPDQLPHTTKLIRDYVGDFQKLRHFYAHPPDLKSVEAEAKSMSFPAERRREVSDILRGQNSQFGSGPKTLENLDRLAHGAVAVVSGQQVGLFGGPAYAFYKALSAIHTARQLSKDGIEAVPVFWMATEDHDVDEVRHTTWFSEGKLYRFELPKPAGDDIPVGRIPLGPEIGGVVQEALALLSGPDLSLIH